MTERKNFVPGGIIPIRDNKDGTETYVFNKKCEFQNGMSNGTSENTLENLTLRNPDIRVDVGRPIFTITSGNFGAVVDCTTFVNGTRFILNMVQTGEITTNNNTQTLTNKTLSLPTSGGVASNLNYYEEGSFNQTFEGAFDITLPIRFTRIGNQVTLRVPEFNGTVISNETLYAASQMPSRLCATPQFSVFRFPVIFDYGDDRIVGEFSLYGGWPEFGRVGWTYADTSFEIGKLIVCQPVHATYII